MAITPVGNNGFNYIPGQMAGQTGKVGATVKADKPEINTQGCQT